MSRENPTSEIEYIHLEITLHINVISKILIIYNQMLLISIHL